MKVILLPELSFGQSDAIASYLQSKNFFRHGRVFESQTGISEAGKFLLLPENLDCIKSLDFGSDKYYLELPVDHEWLHAEHHKDEDDNVVTHIEVYDVAINLAEDKNLVKITNQNYRELAQYFDFTEGQENVFANAKYTAHYNEYYQSDDEDLPEE